MVGGGQRSSPIKEGRGGGGGRGRGGGLIHGGGRGPGRGGGGNVEDGDRSRSGGGGGSCASANGRSGRKSDSEEGAADGRLKGIHGGNPVAGYSKSPNRHAPVTCAATANILTVKEASRRPDANPNVGSALGSEVPGTVQSLMARFGPESSDRSNGLLQDPVLGESSCEGKTKVWSNATFVNDVCMGGDDEDINLKWKGAESADAYVLQGDSNMNDSAMTDLQNGVDRTPGVRSYASLTTDGVDGFPLAGRSSTLFDNSCKTTSWADEPIDEEGSSCKFGKQPLPVLAKGGGNDFMRIEESLLSSDKEARTNSAPAAGLDWMGNTGVLNPDGGPQANAWKRVEPVRISCDLAKKDVTADGVTVDLNLERVHNNAKRLRKALVGTLLGRKIPFHFLNAELRRRWTQFGNFQLVVTGPDSFMCIFEEETARDAVMMGGPWFVAGQIIGMDKWSLSASPSSLDGMTAPIWIRMPGLPMVYWDEENLTRIALMFGQPLWVDGHTKSWGRGGYARVCVKIDLSKKLLPGIHINGAHGKFYQAVEYEGITHMCFKCGLAGHKDISCPTNPRTKFTNGKPVSTPPRVGTTALPRSTLPPEMMKESESATGRRVDAHMVNHAPDDPAGSRRDMQTEIVQDSTEGELGPWMLVTRRKTKVAAKAKAKTNQPNFVKTDKSVPRVKEGVEPTGVPLDTNSMITKPIFGSGLPLQQGNGLNAAPSGVVDESITVFAAKPDNIAGRKGLGTSRAGKARVSKALLKKQLTMLGPVEPLSRKRRKSGCDISDGGDASPSVEI